MVYMADFAPGLGECVTMMTEAEGLEFECVAADVNRAPARPSEPASRSRNCAMLTLCIELLPLQPRQVPKCPFSISRKMKA